jgi:hypothetical protein
MGISSRTENVPQIYQMWKEGEDDEANSQDIPTKVQELLTKYLKIRDAEKNKFGEVFTPPSLIKYMLDKLGEYDKDAWTNPMGTFLDPAAGICNFAMVAYVKLMKGLTKAIPDDRKRSEHIIKNMLFNVEINPKNVLVARRIFGKNANIACGSSLEGAWVEGPNGPSWKTGSEKKPVTEGVIKFGVVMGNPPFQKEVQVKAVKASGRRTLWNEFVELALRAVSDKGYVTFIHPSNWRGLGEMHYLWDELTHKQLLYLRIYGESAGQKMFNVGSRFDVYLFQNSPNRSPTTVIDELGNEHKIQLSEWPFLPNYDYTTFKRILTNEANGIKVIYNTDYHTSKGLEKKPTQQCALPIVHNITKQGLGVRYACIRRGHFGVPKVILNFNRQQYAYKEQNDYEGRYGMSQISFGIPIKSKHEGEEILKAINTNTFKRMIAATKWAAFQTDYRMFKYFKPDWYKIVLGMETDRQQGEKNTQGPQDLQGQSTSGQQEGR